MRLQAGGIAIEVDDQGRPGDDPVLLVMGLGMQLTAWPQELVQRLVSRGHRVIRFDNRDIGLSQHFDHLGVPSVAWAAMRHAMHLPVRAPYTLAEMAADTIGVLDALGLARVHLCGASMGGMIGMHVAARHPERVKSLTLMMTTSGARGLPGPSWPVQRVMMSRPARPERAAVVEFYERLLRAIGSPAYPPDPALLRERVQAMVDRSYHPAGSFRQLLAVAADGDRSPLLQRIGAPVHLIHGDADPLVPLPAAHDLQRKLPGATLDVVPGMGHDLPLQLLERFVDGIASAVRRAGGL